MSTLATCPKKSTNEARSYITVTNKMLGTVNLAAWTGEEGYFRWLMPFHGQLTLVNL